VGPAPETLTGLLAGWADDAPDDVVVRERQGRQRALTIGALVAAADGRAAALAALGAAEGRAVVAWLPNRVEYVELLAGAARLGATVVGLNTRYRADELTHVVARCDAAVLVAVDEFAGVRFAEIAATATLPPDLAIVVVTDGDGPDPGWAEAHDRAVDWRAAGGDFAELGPPPAGDDLLIAFTTSGTTGLPKVAAHDHAGTVRHARADAVAFDIGGGDRLLLDLPLCGTFGFSSLVAAIAGRATTLIHERFVPDDTVDAFIADGVTHYFAADDMLLRVLATGRLAGASVVWRSGGFANFVNAGPAVAAQVEEELGVRLTGLYGMSEVFALLARWPAALPVAARSRAGGIPVDDALAVRVIDPDTGVERPAGVDGELCFRGPSVLARYLGDPEATARALGEDGWFRSGDLGRRTGDGGFEFLARLGDTLRLRGFLVDPAEIERRLETHPDVELAQVVGAERPVHGQVAVAFVKLRSGAATSEDDLRRHCAAGIAELKVPTRILFVDEFPTVEGPNGRKIRKHDLRALAAAAVIATASGD